MHREYINIMLIILFEGCVFMKGKNVYLNFWASWCKDYTPETPQ